MSYFIDRKDTVKLIPHLKAFHKEIIHDSIFPDQVLYLISLDFEKTEICRNYDFFWVTLYQYISDYKLSTEFHQLALKIRLEHFGQNRQLGYSLF